MNSIIILSATFFLLVFAIALGYAALRIWGKRNISGPADMSAGFRPRIGFSWLDGMASLSLVLTNRSKTRVWAEEIEIFLTGLRAEEQATEPPCRGIQKIRQMVEPRDTLPVSLAEVIYKAAGNPQRKYSCVLSSILRYRIGEESLEKNLENYRIQMIGLTAASVHRERKPVNSFQTQVNSPDVPVAATKLK